MGRKYATGYGQKYYTTTYLSPENCENSPDSLKYPDRGSGIGVTPANKLSWEELSDEEPPTAGTGEDYPSGTYPPNPNLVHDGEGQVVTPKLQVQGDVTEAYGLERIEQINRNPKARIPATPGKSGSSEIYRSLAKAWADVDGLHTFLGDMGEPLRECGYGDIQQFLEDYGFKQIESTPLPSPTSRPTGEEKHQHSDGRTVVLVRELSPWGIPQVTVATGSQSDAHTFELLAIGDLVQFVIIGRETTAPEKGGEIVG